MVKRSNTLNLAAAVAVLATTLIAASGPARAQVAAHAMLAGRVDGGVVIGAWEVRDGQTSLVTSDRLRDLTQRFTDGRWAVTEKDGLTIRNGSSTVAKLENVAFTDDRKSFLAHFKDDSQQLDAIIEVTGDKRANAYLYVTRLDPNQDGLSTTTYVRVTLKLDGSAAAAP